MLNRFVKMLKKFVKMSDVKTKHSKDNCKSIMITNMYFYIVMYIHKDIKTFM